MFTNENSFMLKYTPTTGNPKNLGLYERSGTSFFKTTDTAFNGSKEYYVSMGQYLVEIEYQYPKLWASDSGRNLKGKQTGTLIGIFPKLICQFRRLKKEEVIFLRPMLDASTQIIYYFDPWKNAMNKMETYTGDWSIKNNHIINGNMKNQNFQISFIAREKRK